MESLEGVMEVNHHDWATFQYPCHRPPQDLYEAYDSGVAIPFWDQDNGLLVTLLFKVTLAEGDLGNPEEIIPKCGFK